MVEQPSCRGETIGELLVAILFLWLVFCGGVAAIGRNKGRSALKFFLLSFLLSPLIGLIVRYRGWLVLRR